MKKTKIDWCDCTVNPVVGCKRGCPYCYAKKINDRFHNIPDFAVPQLKPELLAPLRNRNPKSVFADSMSDPEYWTEGQTVAVIEWMKKSNYNAFVLLTKSPKTINSIRSRKDAKVLFDPSKQKLFLGYSCGSVSLIKKAFSECPDGWYDADLDTGGDGLPFRPDFLSVEPLEEDISIPMFNSLSDLAVKIQQTLKLVIIGSETGNRKGRVECKKEWVDSIVSVCGFKGTPVFMKSSLKGIMGKDFRQDKLPWPVGEKTK